jgi:hypothetical protein
MGAAALRGFLAASAASFFVRSLLSGPVEKVTGSYPR